MLLIPAAEQLIEKLDEYYPHLRTVAFRAKTRKGLQDATTYEAHVATVNDLITVLDENLNLLRVEINDARRTILFSGRETPNFTNIKGTIRDFPTLPPRFMLLRIALDDWGHPPADQDALRSLCKFESPFI
jgi:hypothetical protein